MQLTFINFDNLHTSEFCRTFVYNKKGRGDTLKYSLRYVFIFLKYKKY